ncbi:MAG: DEAD/DEAH box helicase [Desulfovibrionales bacterium]
MPPDRSAALDALLQSLHTSPFFRPQLVYHKLVPGREAEFGSPEVPWPLPVLDVMQSLGIPALFAHQARAVDAVRAGRHTVVATPTASGKTLVYTLPILERFLENPQSRALYLSPLKALAQDQHRGFQKLVGSHAAFAAVQAAIYDGDTAANHRKKIRDTPPHLLLSNPEMLHLSILPYHQSWAPFLQNLSFVVVDEVHTYRGVMGSHMAWVFRRLLRLCRYYGSSPTFVFSSAIIGNPGELAGAITGLDVETITRTGAPSGGRHFFFLNPLDGAAQTTVTLLLSALAKGIRTIVYTGSRKMTELISMWCAQRLGPLKNKVSAYRAGFLPEERRLVEARLASGELLGVISTSALELGIDIGALDLCILVGYPGSVMATLQRGGRVGRSRRDCAVIMVGQEDALDQYFMNNPTEFFSMEPESAVINPDNPVIMRRHLECAAADLPLKVAEPLLQPQIVRAELARLVNSGRVLKSAAGDEYCSARKYPQRDVDLRGAGRRLTIFDTKTREHIGEIDLFRSFSETHPGAVYLHRGQTYVVDALEPETGSVFAHKDKVHYFTRARQEKETEILEVTARRPVHGTFVSCGRIRVTARVTGYEKRLVKGQRLLAVVPLDLPPLTFETFGLWIEVPDPVRIDLEQRYMHFMGGIHAVEHAAIGILPLLILTDRNDLGGISTPMHHQAGSAAVFIYDGMPGGVGLTMQAFERAEELLSRTLQVILRCPCETGCPSCVHSPKCGSGNRPIDKSAAAAVLTLLLEGNFDPAPAPLIQTMQDPAHQVSGKPQPRVDAAEDLDGFPDRPRTMPGRIEPGDSAGSPDQDPCVPAEEFLPDAKPGGPLRYAVLDLETCRSAAEVGGWHNASQMGVSCVVLFDSAGNRFLEFRGDEIPALVGHLVEFDLVVGFNISRFDYAVLSGCSRFDFHSLPTLDMLAEVRRRLGYPLSLDHLARHTLNAAKSGNGLQALAWWKQGRIEEIIAYCRQDVSLTRDLYLYGRKNGHLLFQNKAKSLVRCPVNWT